MKRRAASTVTSLGFSVVALVIFAVFIIAFFPTLSSTYSLFASETNENKAPIEFYNRLIEELNKETAGTELLFTTNDNFVLVGFGKEQSSYSGRCGSAYFSELKKPLKCEGKGCLCLCDVKLITNEMCNTPEDICTVFEQNVMDSKSECNILVLSTETIANLDVKKDNLNIDINVLSSKKLSS